MSQKFKTYIYNCIKEITYKIATKAILFKQYPKNIKILSFSTMRGFLYCLLSLIIFFSNVLICKDWKSNIIFIEGYEEDVSLTKVSSSPDDQNPIGIDIKKIEMPYWWINLEYPEGYPGINDDIITEYCNLIFYPNDDNINELMLGIITTWINNCQTNSLLENAFTDSGKSPQYYSNKESEYINTKDEIFSSNLLDEVIEGRVELFESYPNGTLAWLLANSYQIYAFNYLKRTNEANSILYLYMKSIYYSQKSLEFEMDIEGKNKIIKYIQMRYKDIADCEILDNEIRVRAYEIYDAIDNALNILNIDVLLLEEIEVK